MGGFLMITGANLFFIWAMGLLEYNSLADMGISNSFIRNNASTFGFWGSLVLLITGLQMWSKESKESEDTPDTEGQHQGNKSAKFGGYSQYIKPPAPPDLRGIPPYIYIDIIVLNERIFYIFN